MMKELFACGAAAASCAAGAVHFKPGETMHGFKVVSLEELPDIAATLVKMEYSSNGAELLWLDRDDDNMTFAIAFRTVPEDDTGVAHILEHSVLCGSRKYPVKEPFVELLKSSFATFINAWTASDHTAYPVCSRDATDLLNLMDVYLDAVFHPLSVESPAAFMQEGWHFEGGADGEPPSINGIVYSEMKGAFADPRNAAMKELERLLFDGNAYGFVSGGDPESIPSLTFEKYVDFHKRHYHPSNAKVFIDGKAPVNDILAKLDSFFAAFPRKEIETSIPPVPPRKASRTVAYPIEKDEDPSGRAIVADGRLFCGCNDVLERCAADIVADYFTDSNDAPVMKALFEKNLCDDASMWTAGAEQTYIAFFAENVRDGMADEVRRTARSAVENAISSGFDRERLEALVSKAEFGYRESDFGTQPRGLAYFSAAMDLWPYGGDPAAAFKLSGVFDELRRWIAEGRFEKFAKKILLDNPSLAAVTLLPEPGLAEKRDAALAASLAAAHAGRTAEEKRAALADAALLDAFRNKTDTAEELAKLPRLPVSAIPIEPPLPEAAEESAGAAKSIRVKTHAEGIVYATLAFPADVSNGEKLSDLAFAANIAGDIATKRRSALELSNDIDSNLGRFSTSAVSVGDGGKPDPRGSAYLVVSAAALESKADEIARLLPEILRESDFGDARRIGDLQKQHRSSMEFAIGGLGAIKFAKSRAGAAVSGAAALDDLFDGISALRRLQACDDSFDADPAGRCGAIAAAFGETVANGAEYVFVSANAPAGFAARLSAAFPFRAPGPATRFMPPRGRAREAFVCPGAVAAAAKAFFMSEVTGSDIVAARLLSLEHLWNEIRVVGGAYGASLTETWSGLAEYVSWNDPTPGRSLSVYDRSGDALRKAAEKDVSRYIVGAVAKTEPYLSPSAEISLVVGRTLCGRTQDDVRRARKEMLSADAGAMRRAAEKLDAVRGSESVCIIGGKEQIEACRDKVDSIESIRP